MFKIPKIGQVKLISEAREVGELTITFPTEAGGMIYPVSTFRDNVIILLKI